MSPNVVADTSAHINQEVIGTGVARAEIDAVAGRLIAVEASTLPSDAAEQISASFLAKARLKDAIEGE